MQNPEIGPDVKQPGRDRPEEESTTPKYPFIPRRVGSFPDLIPERFGGGGSKPPQKPKAPSGPDRDPKGEHKFKVRVEDPKEIFEQLKEPTLQGNVYNFCSTPLEYPLERLSVTGLSDGQRFSSLVQFIFDMGFRPGEGDLPFAEHILTERFKIRQVGRDILVLDDQGKPDFYIGQESTINKLMIGVGKDKQMLVGPVPPKRLAAFPDFKTWVEKYAAVIEATTNAVYEGANQWSPDIELVFRPQMKDRAGADAARIRNLMARLGGEAENLKDKLQVEIPNVKFEDIGGQEKAKREIQSLAFALKNPELYKKWGTKPPKGILLYGPPGTGKTLMAKALATEAEAQFLSISISDITSKWYGESEKLMQQVFDLAKDFEGNTILFFDEVDAIAQDRAEASEVSRRTISTLLTNLDGIGSNPNVMMVCATNRLEAIDPALTRPGRLDRLVEVPLPDETGRKQIFSIHIKQAEKLAERELFNGVDFDQIVAKTDKASGADIAEIIRRVLEEKVRQEGTTGKEPDVITTEDILREIEGYERIKQEKRRIGFTSTR